LSTIGASLLGNSYSQLKDYYANKDLPKLQPKKTYSVVNKLLDIGTDLEYDVVMI